MNEETVSGLKQWFEDYVNTFQSGNVEYKKNIDLKRDHTRRVCEEILDIGKSLDLGDEDLRLAQVIALFHDVGRFSQYARYGTFSDLRSEDHALLGARILREKNVLKDIGPEEEDLILRAVTYHNRSTLPEKETEKCLFMTRLLRDADKLDIWRVVTDYYREQEGSRNGALELDMPDSPDVSPKVCEDLMAQRIVKMGNLRTLNDFKLLQMGWVFDINFPRTFHLIRERGFLAMIRDALPESQQVLTIYSQIESYLERHCPDL